MFLRIKVSNSCMKPNIFGGYISDTSDSLASIHGLEWNIGRIPAISKKSLSVFWSFCVIYNIFQILKSFFLYNLPCKRRSEQKSFFTSLGATPKAFCVIKFEKLKEKIFDLFKLKYAKVYNSFLACITIHSRVQIPPFSPIFWGGEWEGDGIWKNFFLLGSNLRNRYGKFSDLNKQGDVSGRGVSGMWSKLL